ncbi:MAG: biosynthetic-type acetolactate synthase large subunit [Clostridia bacterium]
MMINGAQIIIEELVRNGVDTVFGYPGGTVLPLYEELYLNADRINHVITAHEQGAAHAADGYARATGTTGVVIATSGPGATNLVTGIANAYLDSIPMVAITGNVAVPLIGKDSFQEVDIMGITQPVVKHNFVVRYIEHLPFILSEAFKIASTGRKGPVLVDVPKDIQTSMYDYEPATKSKIKGPKQVDFALDRALEALKESKRPFIYAGGGVIASGAEKELLAFSQKINAPIALSMMGLTAISADYDLNLGMCGMHGSHSSNLAQANSDLIIAVGVRFSDRATGDVNKYADGKKVIHIDIDRAEICKNIHGVIPCQGDIKNVLNVLLTVADDFKNDEWLKQIEEYKAGDINIVNDEFTPKNIIEAVNATTEVDTVIATDVGQHQMWTMLYYKFRQPRTLLTSGGLGTMGYGLGAAIGGCIGAGRKRTILFTGDGSFGMNLNEMATAVSQKLPITVVLLNNGVLGMVRQWQTMFYDKHYSSTTLARKTNFAMLGQAFGANGYTATTLAELNAALEATKDSEYPTIIDCQIFEDEMVLPMIPPGGSVADIVVK